MDMITLPLDTTGERTVQAARGDRWQLQTVQQAGGADTIGLSLHIGDMAAMIVLLDDEQIAKMQTALRLRRASLRPALIRPD